VLLACAPIPTSDSSPAPRASSTPVVAAPNVRTPVPTEVLPEGGAIAIGVIGNTTLEINVMPGIVQDAVFDSLLRVDPANGSLKPGLAESFQVSNDATTITFRLRAGVKWHNGAPLTSDDVVATIKAFSSPSFRGKPVTDFGTLSAVSAIDAQTIQITFSDAHCPALASIGTLKILPRAIATNPSFPRLTPAQMIGTGAMKFVSLSNDRFVLERNTDYFAGAPHLDNLTIRLFADAATMRTAFSAREIDAMPGDYTALQKIDGAKTTTTNASEFVALMFNLDTPALNDPRVRQALSYALNRSVLQNDLAGQATPINTSLLPGYWASPPNLPSYSFDVAKAKQILSDAGWRDSGDGVLRNNGKPLRLDLWTLADDPMLEPLAFRIREMFAALGIQTQLQLDDRPGWVTHAFQHRFDLLLLARPIPLDPDQRWYWHSAENVKGSGFNFGSYANKNVDALLQAGTRVAACDANARATIYGEIHRALIADAPVVFLFAPKQAWATRDRVLNLAPSPFAGDFWNMSDWRVKP